MQTINKEKLKSLLCIKKANKHYMLFSNVGCSKMLKKLHLRNVV